LNVIEARSIVGRSLQEKIAKKEKGLANEPAL
jgi:hypothetical protein